MCASIGKSARQIDRLFHQYVGTSPKSFHRLSRFQNAVHSIRFSRRRPWALLALDLGYYDQAHFINEFNRFSGWTPNEFSPVFSPESPECPIFPIHTIQGLRLCTHLTICIKAGLFPTGKDQLLSERQVLEVTMIDLIAARNFVYANGAMWEKALFAHLFEDGPIDRLYACLLCYKNKDGGWGHGLEQ